MATVTVFTADRMKTIENKSVVSGSVIGDNLILTHYDGSQINAGNVRGPKGTNGAPGYTSIVVCSSTSRPAGAALFNGLAIYETDTNRFLIWNGIAWTQPWNSSWGQVAYGDYRSTYTLPTAFNVVNLPNITMPANRKLRLAGYVNFYGNADQSIVQTTLMVDGTQIGRGLHQIYMANNGLTASVNAYTTSQPGTHTYTFKLDRVVGIAAITIVASNIDPGTLIVEDVGPAGQPA